ncbi:glycosyltransferase family protein [Pseudomonas atacamensis]|uniref:glycosyltransferase family protein n=1 Tax=Pseudomonas atacamensis TaxID=2565368 RepID=UPI0021DAE27B|nr:hypothetical protein [Pseudomonas atacamensis]
MAGHKNQIESGMLPSVFFPRWTAVHMNRLIRFFSRRTAKVEEMVMTPDSTEEAPLQTPSAHELMCAALIDKEFYLEIYPDIAAAGVDPLKHYIDAGYREGRCPLNLHSANAAIKVANALEYAPADITALSLHITLELACSDFDRVNAAAALYKNHVLDHPQPFPLIGSFEQAASFMVGSWIRHESLISISVIKELISKILGYFPESCTLSALYGILLFEYGELTLAKKELSKNPELRNLPPEVLDICRQSLQQISDAEAVNARPVPDAGILLLDSAFPSKISSFRYGEFSTYLTTIEDSALQTRPDKNLFRYGESSTLAVQINDFAQRNGIARERVRRFDTDHIGNPKVAYCVFLNLADLFFTQIGIPAAKYLIFTLYPGGGFAPNDPRSDASLRRLCDNPKVSRIITTQIPSYRYLIDNGFCSPDRIVHIFGGIIPELYSETPPIPRTTGKPAIDVCFVAQRYSPTGAEKGYDVFAQIINKFSNNPYINFHIVGGFDASVIDLGNSNNVTFHGTKPASFFPEFYSTMDAILSPNIQRSTLDPKVPETFDGFPTTCVVEAGLQGVAMFLTDFQNMNQNLAGTPIFSADEMEIINRDCEMICARLQYYIENREELHKLGQKGRMAILREFSFERQMVPRIALLKNHLSL